MWENLALPLSWICAKMEMIEVSNLQQALRKSKLEIKKGDNVLYYTKHYDYTKVKKSGLPSTQV